MHNMESVGGENLLTENIPEDTAGGALRHGIETPPIPREAIIDSQKIHENDVAQEARLEVEFAMKHTLELGTNELEYTILHGTGEASANEWVIFVGGFGSIKETYKSEMLDLARTGRNVLFVSPDIGALPSVEEEQYFSAKHMEVAETIEKKAVALLRLIDHLGISSANIIGHSQGGAISAVLSGMRPALATRLILDNSAGLVGRRSTGELLHGVHAEAKKEARSWRQRLSKLAHFPLWRATREIPGIAHTDIRPILGELKQKDDEGGPEIILINSNDDRIFRKGDVEGALGDNPLEKYIDRWAMYADKDAGHGKTERKSGIYPQIIDEFPTRGSIIHQIITEKGGDQV